MGWNGPITARQFAIWSVWTELEWNRPDRTDHYLMRIAERILQVNVKNPTSINLGQQKIEFRRADEKPKETRNKEHIAAFAKAAWLARVKKPPVRVEKEEP